MATTAIKAFEEFRDRNALTATQRAAIKNRRERVRSILANDGWIISETKLGGSHARATKVRLPSNAKSDVDIYVVLDPSYRSSYGGWSGKEPRQLLSKIKASLDKTLTTPAVRADSPSVRIRYSDMDVDVVPAFACQTFFRKTYDLPYYDRWMTATPDQQRSSFSALNAKSGYRLIHLVRMIKYWKYMRPSFPLRSYHLEVLAYNIFSQRPPVDYRNALASFFREAAVFVQYSWDDPGGSGTSVSGYMTTAQRNTAVGLFQAAADRADAAIAKATWSDEIGAWRSSSMFGSRFPTYTPY